MCGLTVSLFSPLADTLRPTITTAVSRSGAYATASPITGYSVLFSEIVLNVTGAAFTIAGSTAGGVAVSVTGGSGAGPCTIAACRS